MANGRKPSHIVKHDVRGEDGKTVRSTRVGALWESPDGVKPTRIKLDYIPVGFDGFLTIWPNTEREDRGE